MNQEYKQKWIDALRSGKYKQRMGRLCDDNKHCCLGVLCELLVADDKAIKQSIPPSFGFSFGAKYGDIQSCTLTPEIQNLVGLQASNEDILIEMNDAGQSFKEIADYIETTL